MKATEELIKKEIIGVAMTMGTFDMQKKIHYISFEEIMLKGLIGDGQYTTASINSIKYVESTGEILLADLSWRNTGFHFYPDELSRTSLVDLCEAIKKQYPLAFRDFEFRDYRYALDMFGQKIKVGDIVGFKDENGVSMMGSIDTIDLDNLLTFTNVNRLTRSISSDKKSICGNVKEIVKKDDDFVTECYVRRACETVFIESMVPA